MKHVITQYSNVCWLLLISFIFIISGGVVTWKKYCPDQIQSQSARLILASLYFLPSRNPLPPSQSSATNISTTYTITHMDMTTLYL